jgi:cytochrome c oxidase subunit 2
MWREWIPFWHAGASPYGGDVDLLFLGLVLVSALVLALLFSLLAYFCIQYRAGHQVDRSNHEEKSWRVEVGWTVASFVAFLGLFIWGAAIFLKIYQTPTDELTVFVVAQQWMWKVQHAGGQAEINALHVPVNRPIKLVMASQDVIHSFFIPALRLKHDVVPGRYQDIQLEIRRPGHYHLFCAEYCGTDHSRMLGEIFAMEQADYAAWLAGQKPDNSLAQDGEVLFRQLGCSGCHEGQGSVRAPSLKGLYGKPVPLSNGTMVTADEKYLRDSILLPRSQVAAGYEPVMPSFAGRIKEDELLKLVTYIKSLARQRP